VAVPAVSDEVHHHVAAERRAVVRGNFAHAHHAVRIFRVYVENRHILALGQIGREA